jgi:hypothetical protein
MREGRKSRVFLTCVLLVWLLLLAFLFVVGTSAGKAFAHTAEDLDVELPNLTKDICLPALLAFDTSPFPNVIALVVWGGVFCMPLLAILLIWILEDIQRIRWWFLFLAICNVAWIVVVGVITAVGVWLPSCTLTGG